MVKKSHQYWWTRLIGYVKVKFQQHKAKKEQEPPSDRAARLTSHATFWMALFTFVLSITSVVTVCVLRNQLKAMRIDQRAWISVATPRTKPPVNDPILHIKTITITNTGKTPALQLTAHLFVEVVPNGSQPHFAGGIPHMVYIAGAVFPNNPEELLVPRLQFKQGNSGDTEDLPISAGERDALKEGRAWLATYGLLDYWDVFKKQHWTQFCNWDNYKAGVWYSAQGCSEYNNVDGE